MGERIICEVRDYSQFTEGLRAWLAELRISYETANEIAGLQPNYLSKMIAKSPVRSFSRVSLGSTLGALGLKLLLAVDAEKLAAMAPRYTVRKKDTSGRVPAQKKTLLRGNPELARFYAHRRALLQSPKRRKAIARKAIRIRWRHVKAAASPEGVSPTS